MQIKATDWITMYPVEWRKQTNKQTRIGGSVEQANHLYAAGENNC